MLKNLKNHKLKSLLSGLLMFVLLLSMMLLPGCGTASTEETVGETLAIVDASDESSFETVAETSADSQEETVETEQEVTETEAAETELTVEKNGEYSSKEEVALYIHTYGKLPSNYITKRDAEDLGWSSSEGNLWEVAPGKSIGGSRFGNYEGLLPDKNGRKYYECDIDYDGGYRNAKRIIYSNDGLVFYTEDHYETFEQLY